MGLALVIGYVFDFGIWYYFGTRLTWQWYDVGIGISIAGDWHGILIGMVFGYGIDIDFVNDIGFGMVCIGIGIGIGMDIGMALIWYGLVWYLYWYSYDTARQCFDRI